MGTLTKYRSRFTGAEIDTLLASISNKIDSSIIINDFSGGTTKVASAELAKILYADFQSLSNPNYLLSIIETIPDFNVFTTAEKTKLDGMSGEFKGVFQTTTDRDNNLVTTSYVGGECCIIVDVANSLGEIEEWVVGYGWTRIELYNLGNLTTVTMSSTTATVYTYSTLIDSTAKMILTAQKVIGAVNNIQSIELLVCSNGTDVFYTTYGNIGNNNSLVTINVSYSSPTVTVYISGTSGTSINGRVSSLF